MRPRVLSIVSNRKFDSHVTWLVDRLENDLGLDSQISECYARFVISSLIGQNGEIDPKREQELFVYDRPSPNSNEKNSLIDTRSPIEIVISELEAVTSCDPSRKKVATLVSKLSRRLENFKRKRFNSETSDLSATSSQSSTSSYEAEFPQLPSRQPNAQLSKSANREKQEERPFRFAFKNPQVRVRSKSGTGPTSRKNQTPRSKSGSNHKNPKPNTPSPEKNERRKRKRHRKKKKPTEEISCDSTSPVMRNVATYENFDHLSMDQALDFVQNFSGQSEDRKIWTSVVKNQHVKYMNGTFFFTPRALTPVSKPVEKSQNYKTKFFLDLENRTTGSDNTGKIEPVIDDGLSHAAEIANRVVEIIIEEPEVSPEISPVSTPSGDSGRSSSTSFSEKWPVLSTDSNSVNLEFNPWTIW